jgi:hypothetical protein
MAGRRAGNFRSASDPGSTAGDSADTPPVPQEADSALSPPEQECDLCHGHGYFRWTQMCTDGVLRELQHPCIHGCGGWWKQPAARSDEVVDVIDVPASDD